MKIKLLERGVFVSALAWQIRLHPELWNEHRERTESGPHAEVDDIWARYAKDPKEAGPHESIWYPAAEVLGEPLTNLVNWVMFRCQGKTLGGVLITRIQAGKSCKPHEDHGWHARQYDKVAVQIESAPRQKFCFEGEELETQPGDVFTFDNQHKHWVTNPTAYERVTLIVCLKR